METSALPVGAFELPQAIGTPRIPLAWSFSALAQPARLHIRQPLAPWPRVRDLPESERAEFSAWMEGQTRPRIAGEPESEQDGYFSAQLDAWRDICWLTEQSRAKEAPVFCGDGVDHPAVAPFDTFTIRDHATAGPIGSPLP